MEGIKRNIPNMLTLANLCCGLCSTLFAANNHLFLAGTLIFIGATLDFFDGFIARLINMSSKFGKQLDSFADMVTFGVAPGIILFQLIYFSTTGTSFQYNIDKSFFIPLIGMLIPICAAIRLARFNLNSKEINHFIGLPTPAAAIFIASLPIIPIYHNSDYLFIDTVFLSASSIILSLTMISPISIFSLKITKKYSITSKLNIIRILFLISSLILLFTLQFISIPFIVILYIFLSILNNLIQ